MKVFSIKVILLVCYLTFFAQFYSLTRDYLRFQTSTRVTYQVDDVIAVPASTVCFKVLFPIWDMHLKAFKNKSGFYERSYNLDGSWLDMELGRQCKAFGEKYSVAMHPPGMSDSERAQLGCLLHFYDNPSVRQYLSGGLFDERFWCEQAYISQRHGDARSKDQCRKTLKYCEDNGFVAGISFQMYTCLSVYVENNDCLQIDKDGHYGIIFWRGDVFTYDKYRFILHEAKRTPHWKATLVFDSDYEYPIRYSRIVVKRLEAPYDTDCHHYHSSKEQGPISQSDCVAHCFAASLVSNASLGFFSQFYNYECPVMRQELFPEGAMMSEFLTTDLPDIYFEVYRPLELACEKRCRPECQETLYVYKAVRDGDRVRKTQIRIFHDAEADVRYEHFETIGLVDYLSSVGGVAGMWVGVSLASLFSTFFDFLFKQYARWRYRWCRRKRRPFVARHRVANMSIQNKHVLSHRITNIA